MAVATPSSILALDVGEKRVGVAVASRIARLPHPLTTLDPSDGFFDALKAIVQQENIDTVVVGFPRGLSGQHTQQTASIEAFTVELKTHVTLPVYFQDEALTSQKAKDELAARGGTYSKGDVDALAATYILEDFLNEHLTTEGALSA